MEAFPNRETNSLHVGNPIPNTMRASNSLVFAHFDPRQFSGHFEVFQPVPTHVGRSF